MRAANRWWPRHRGPGRPGASQFYLIRQSGNGARELGTFGIDEYLQIKSIQR
jgi:acyl-CoA reductase-like NAD-dependent aldehyde dehydrogenase